MAAAGRGSLPVGRQFVELVLGRRSLRRENLGETVDVDLGERALALAHLALEPGDELGAEDVDLPVEDPAAVRDRALLLHELADEIAQLLVGQRVEVGKGFHDYSVRFGIGPARFGVGLSEYR